ncbi:Dethiobiotin synthetase [Mastigocoleus sp. MO_188.B34]|uniref:Dethiobiotin synthetase n=1 Tax=Mastigocoleus sp. MO_188.B34 TaxID=3036635 RepID=UPI002611C199|nr:Dethiobiotin synthetase [Mastigocoleus sp. MO_188.B34]MDJ0693704.1 Dethiobiotin synthetase [Mastigocoleus sp. MO_188.B34]
MNYETARKLLISQTVSLEDNADALIARMQQGKPPVPGQVTSILLALKVLHENLKDSKTLDRELAYSLYKLTVSPQKLFAAGYKAGINWPPLLKEDLLRIGSGCENIFSGIWQQIEY